MRNLNKPPRYNVASIQAQQTLGVNVMQCNEEGHYVEWRDYAWLLTEKQRLDAEVKELKHQPDPLTAYLYAAELAKEDMKKLKAEVERLKEGNEYLGQMHDKEMERSAYLCEQVERLEKGILPAGSNDAVGRAVNVLIEKEKEIARLKAEVERLRKAGTAMGMCLPDTDEANKAYRDFEAGGQS